MDLDQQLCYICNDQVQGTNINIFVEYAKRSKKHLSTVLEHLLGQNIERTNVAPFYDCCKSCVIKLNKYDRALSTVDYIREEITQRMQNYKRHLIEIPVTGKSTHNVVKSQHLHSEKTGAKLIKEELHQRSFVEEQELENLSIEYLTGVQQVEDQKLNCKTFLESFQFSTNTNDPEQQTAQYSTKEVKSESCFYVCPDCDKISTDKCLFECHLATHTKDKDYTCNICHKKFVRFLPFCRHKKRHEQRDVHINCEICEYTAYSKINLKHHMKISHPNTPKSYKCKICGKSFTQNSSLHRHMPVHTGEKRFQCEKCGKKYSEHSSFRMHKLAHDNIKNKECSECGLKFRSSSHLNRHMLVHSGLKKFKCEKCDKSFAQRYNMRLHSRKYCDSAKTCNKCSTIFKTKKQLINHMKPTGSNCVTRLSINEEGFLTNNTIIDVDAEETEPN